MESRKKFFVCDENTMRLARMAASATTSEELAKICQRMYIADYINLDGLDLWLSKHALTAVYRVLKEFPALRREINYFGTLRGFVSRKDDLFAFLNPDSDRETRQVIKELTDDTARETKYLFANGGIALAYFASYGSYRFSGIILDESDFDEKNIINDLEFSVSCGYSPKGCGTVKAVIEHEIGHLLDYWLDISNQQELESLMRRLGPAYVQNHLSSYCVTDGVINYAEVVAEGFSEYRNNKQPRKLATYIGDLVNRRYKIKLSEIQRGISGGKLNWI